MIDIERLKKEIVEKLKPLNPDKIILFGSYAYGKPNEDSDIDLFLLKDGLSLDSVREYKRKVRENLRSIYKKYRTNGIDILVASTEDVYKKEDYFDKVDILKNGKIWYERTVS